MARWRSMLLGGLISAGCLFLLLRSVDLRQTRDALANADPFWVLVALALIAAAVVVRCWRWQLLFRPDHRVTLWGTISSTMIGYMFNAVLPGRVGELARASLISQTDRVSTARALGTILVEKILDVLVLLLLLGYLTTVVDVPAWIKTAGLSVSAAFGVVAAAFFALARVRGPFVRWAERRVDTLPLMRRLQPSRLADTVLGAADGLARPEMLAAQLLISAFLWGIALATVDAVLRALNFALPWTAPALVLVTTNLGMTVPAAPASVGVYHYIATLSLEHFGVDRAAALAFAFALHALGFGSFIVVGALLLIAGLARQDYRVADLWRWRSPAPSYD